MEIRKGNLIVGAAGGTAGKDARTYKISLPSAWVQAMGLSAGERQLVLSFDGEQVVLRKAESVAEVAERCLMRGHDVRMLRYYDGSMLCTTICADFTEQTLRVENHTTHLVKTAFGKREYPAWDEFLAFLEERCVPRARAGLREYLQALKLDEYDPVAIIQKTAGRMAEDDQWLEMEVLG